MKKDIVLLVWFQSRTWQIICLVLALLGVFANDLKSQEDSLSVEVIEKNVKSQFDSSFTHFAVSVKTSGTYAINPGWQTELKNSNGITVSYSPVRTVRLETGVFYDLLQYKDKFNRCTYGILNIPLLIHIQYFKWPRITPFLTLGGEAGNLKYNSLHNFYYPTDDQPWLNNGMSYGALIIGTGINYKLSKKIRVIFEPEYYWNVHPLIYPLVRDGQAFDEELLIHYFKFSVGISYCF